MSTLNLSTIAAQLEGLEETIIQKLIDRAQFAANAAAYRPGESGFASAGDKSLFDLRLRYQEEMDAAFGRFKVPEERPFHSDLPDPHRGGGISFIPGVHPGGGQRLKPGRSKNGEGGFLSILAVR